jgi:hypothetical protein
MAPAYQDREIQEMLTDFVIRHGHVLLGDQPPMPGQQRIRRRNRGDIPQDAPSERLGLRRQTTALIVREPQTSRAELFPQGPVLFLEIGPVRQQLTYPVFGVLG